MTRFRIIEPRLGRFYVQRKTWLGWRYCDFIYGWGDRCPKAHGSLESARLALAERKQKYEHRFRVVLEDPA